MAEPIIDDAKLLRDLTRLRATMERKIGALVKDPAARALRSVGEVYMTEAKKRTPVDTGVLRSSGHVRGPEKSGDTWQVRLIFGGPAAKYAAQVHENLTAHHAVGQAKYLESVILEHRKTFTREVAAMMVGGAKVYGSMFGNRGPSSGSGSGGFGFGSHGL